MYISKGDPLKFLEIKRTWTLGDFCECLAFFKEEQERLQTEQSIQKALNKAK